MIYQNGELVNTSNCTYLLHICAIFKRLKFSIQMSTSSSSQAPFAIEENEPMHAPTTLAKRTPSCRSLGLPSPRFPKRLASVEVNALTFEQGFEEQLVEGGIANHVMCAICRCLPRLLATLDGCGHIFCERCINQNFRVFQTRKFSKIAKKSTKKYNFWKILGKVCDFLKRF